MRMDFGKGYLEFKSVFRALLDRVPSGLIDVLVIVAAVFVFLLGVGFALAWALRDF